jgi:hypothetical protein
MNTAFDFNETLQRLTKIYFWVQWDVLDLDQYQFKTRLQTATSSCFNPEVGNAWRTRMIIRSRLRKYTSN